MRLVSKSEAARILGVERKTIRNGIARLRERVPNIEINGMVNLWPLIEAFRQEEYCGWKRGWKQGKKRQKWLPNVSVQPTKRQIKSVERLEKIRIQISLLETEDQVLLWKSFPFWVRPEALKKIFETDQPGAHQKDLPESETRDHEKTEESDNGTGANSFPPISPTQNEKCG